MSKIKTRESVKDIKALDKAATAAERMKDAFVCTKDSAEHTQSPEHDSPSDYAIEKIKNTGEDAAHETVHQAGEQGGRAFHKARDVHRSRKEAKQAADSMKDTVDSTRNPAEDARSAAKSVRKPTGGVKDTADGARGTAGGVKDTTDGIKKSARGTEKAAKGARKSAAGVSDTAKIAQDTSRVAKTAADLPKELMKKRARDTARRSGTHVRQATENAVKATRQADTSVKTTGHTAEQSIKTVDRTAKTTRQTADTTIKTAGRTEKTIKQSVRSVEKGVKSTAKGTVKTARKSIKTAETTAKTTIKTTQQAAKAAQKTAQATAKAARAAAQAARVTARATVMAVKIAVKAAISAVKAIIAATKALISAIAAGSWVAVVVILIICMAALLVCSVFGIFFSSEDGVLENGMTMKAVVAQINTEFSDELARIIDENPHDDYDITSDRAEWKEVLAVYAVKTNTDPDNPLDVMTLDEEKADLLRDVFWDMNIVDYWVETIEHTSTSTDAEGNTTTDTWYEYILHITVTSKTASEMAEQYGFNDGQKAQLEELLRPEYDSLWRAVLYGSSSGSTDIVEVAISQIGNVGGELYWSWYGFDSREEWCACFVSWCACFVSWCANECGYIEAGIIPRFAGCQSQGIPWFKAVDLWQDSGSGYTPNPGDIIFFDWEGDGESDHVGIVEYVEDDRVHTIEGNSSDSCRRRSYSIDSSVIVGYGTPAY